MTKPSPASGKLQMAAALAFHLPGARLDLLSADGDKCSVGPLTDPRCVLHPAEFRELVVTTGGAVESLTASQPQGNEAWAAPNMQLSMAMPGVHHVGGGLYRIAGDEATSYAFVTLLPTKVVDTTLAEMKAAHPLEYDPCQPVPSCHSLDKPSGR